MPRSATGGITPAPPPPRGVLLAVGAPALGFGLWGAVDFHWAGRLSEALRLTQELLLSGVAAVALYAAGQQILGWALALVSVAYHALLYAQGAGCSRSLRLAPARSDHFRNGQRRAPRADNPGAAEQAAQVPVSRRWQSGPRVLRPAC